MVSSLEVKHTRTYPNLFRYYVYKIDGGVIMQCQDGNADENNNGNKIRVEFPS